MINRMLNISHDLEKDFIHLAERSGVSIIDILSERRSRPIVNARCFVAQQLRKRGYSYPRIGAVMKRDHSSIINLCRRRPVDTPDLERAFLDTHNTMDKGQNSLNHLYLKTKLLLEQIETQIEGIDTSTAYTFREVKGTLYAFYYTLTHIEQQLKDQERNGLCLLYLSRVLSGALEPNDPAKWAETMRSVSHVLKDLGEQICALERGNKVNPDEIKGGIQ